MTTEEFRRQMKELDLKIRLSQDKICRQARATVPVLLDAQRPASAKELDALLFEYDALTQEIGELFKTNIDHITDMLGRRERE